MEIILTQNVEKLGRKGDLKKVKDGYFHNYLFPNNMARVATPSLKKWAEREREKAIIEMEQIKEKADELKKIFENMEIVIEEKTTEKDTLYGSVSEKEIADAIEKKARVKLNKKQIILEEPLKKVGSYSIPIHLTDKISCEITVEIKEKSA